MTELDQLKADNAQLLGKVAELESELTEQCRLNGIGSEREAALMGKVERLEKQRGELIRMCDMALAVLLSEPETQRALFKAENLLQEMLAAVKKRDK